MIQTQSYIGLTKNVETKLEQEENPFEKAIIENKRIENKQVLERKKLNDFKIRVKKRLVLYKYAENQLDEDFQLKINLGGRKNPLKIKTINHVENNVENQNAKSNFLLFKIITFF